MNPTPNEPIITEDTKVLYKYYDIKRGVYPEYTSSSEAQVAFRREMRRLGYVPVGNGSWSKPKMAVIMGPKHLKGPRPRSSYGG